MLLTPMKQVFYNKAPICFLQSLSQQGYSIIANNGRIDQMEIQAEPLHFNHSHNETFVNSPASIGKRFKIGNN
jgi:hypothetical protein